jgi:hypothetical protein
MKINNLNFKNKFGVDFIQFRCGSIYSQSVVRYAKIYYCLLYIIHKNMKSYDKGNKNEHNINSVRQMERINKKPEIKNVTVKRNKSFK